MNKYQTSACIGFYRCGVDDATIAAILNCELMEVFRAIKLFKDIERV